MHLLLVGYMFLFIDRPFEVWTWLGDLHFERIYMLVTLGVWLVHPGKRWLPNPQHWAYAAFAAAVLAGVGDEPLDGGRRSRRWRTGSRSWCSTSCSSPPCTTRRG